MNLYEPCGFGGKQSQNISMWIILCALTHEPLEQTEEMASVTGTTLSLYVTVMSNAQHLAENIIPLDLDDDNGHFITH